MAQKTKELITSYTSSGLSKEEFCKHRGISLSTLKYHLAKQRKGKEGSLSLAPSGNFIPLNPSNHTQQNHTIVLIQGKFGRDNITHILKSGK